MGPGRWGEVEGVLVEGGLEVFVGAVVDAALEAEGGVLGGLGLQVGCQRVGVARDLGLGPGGLGDDGVVPESFDVVGWLPGAMRPFRLRLARGDAMTSMDSERVLVMSENTASAICRGG